jgi:hypothetical protein
MPEGQIAVSPDERVFAQYAQPVTRYQHGILGDALEASQLVAVIDGKPFVLTLGPEYVFEDICPRLADVNGDGNWELITIRTHLDRGAGIAVYALRDDSLRVLTQLPEIGTRNRWLNPAAIYDLDGDGQVEIAWVQTPHIGGILKVATFSPDTLIVRDALRLFTNHAIGETNLCLSVLTQHAGQTRCYLPTHDRQRILGFAYLNHRWQAVDSFDLAVDMSLPLATQYDFGPLLSDAHCQP